MAFIFSPLEQDTLGEHIRYLEHGYTMYRKFSRAMENQVFIENGIFWCFEVSEYSAQTLRKVPFFNESLIFHGSRKFSTNRITMFKVSNMFS